MTPEQRETSLSLAEQLDAAALTATVAASSLREFAVAPCHDPMDELRRACAELLGQDPETWPSHGNAPLAIAAAMARAVQNPWRMHAADWLRSRSVRGRYPSWMLRSEAAQQFADELERGAV